MNDSLVLAFFILLLYIRIKNHLFRVVDGMMPDHIVWILFILFFLWILSLIDIFSLLLFRSKSEFIIIDRLIIYWWVEHFCVFRISFICHHPHLAILLHITFMICFRSHLFNTFMSIKWLNIGAREKGQNNKQNIDENILIPNKITNQSTIKYRVKSLQIQCVCVCFRFAIVIETNKCVIYHIYLYEVNSMFHSSCISQNGQHSIWT